MKDFKDLYLLSVAHIKAIEVKLEEVSNKFNQQKIDNELRLLDNADVKQLFNISDKTLSNWRNNGTLEFSKIAGSIYFDLNDVKALIKRSKGGLKKKAS